MDRLYRKDFLREGLMGMWNNLKSLNKMILSQAKQNFNKYSDDNSHKNKRIARTV